MSRKVVIALGVALALTIALVTIALAVSINWGAATNPIYDESGVGNTLLADGDIVQLIWDKDGDGIDPPGIAGYPTSDDELLDSSTIGAGAFANTGKFSKNINTTTVGNGDKVYVRAWNDSSLSSATHYGDSPVFTIDSDVSFTLDATASGSFATTNSKPTTAVTLASFTAIRGDRYVFVQWQTASEINTAGFNLYRSEHPDGMEQGLFTKLSENLIPSQAANPALGASYSYTDTDVQPGVTYYYWLEDVEVTGRTHLHGPVNATLSGSQLYLPLVIKR